jgi:maltooligosyltrehalose trehalohydrolase
MGEEVGSRQPFPWFADYSGQVARKMRKGRMEQFKDLPQRGVDMLDPFDPATITLCHPYGDHAPKDAETWLQMTREVLTLRRNRLLPMFRSGRSREVEVVATGPCSLSATGPCSLSATWHFGDGSLQAGVSFDGCGNDLGAGEDPFQMGQTGSP